MGSNLRELPELVKMAYVIRAHDVQIGSIKPSFPGQEGEVIEVHQADSTTTVQRP
jgi:hypothetical protein